MRTFAQKPNGTQLTTSTKSAIASRARFGHSPDVNSILPLRHTIGNQAVQRLLRPEPEGLKVVSDPTSSGYFGHDLSALPEEPWVGMAGRMETKSASVGDRFEARVEPQTFTPPQLKKKTVLGPTAGDCGFFKWQIRWELDKNTTKGGLVVQKVEGKYDVRDCKGNIYENTTYFNPGWVPYWEAWEIDKGKNVTNYAGYDDKFQSPGSLNGTKGEYSTIASAVFYDGAQLSKTSMKATNGPPAGDLPMTKTDPKLKGGSNSVPHNLKATWDCCSKEKGATRKTNITTD